MLQKREKVISKYPNSYVEQNKLLICKYNTEMTESNITETSTSSLEYWSTKMHKSFTMNKWLEGEKIWITTSFYSYN